MTDSPKHYHGTPCKKCGGTLRWKRRSNNCVPCAVEHSRADHKKHLEKRNKAKRSYYAAHREKIIAANKVNRLKRVYNTTPEEVSALLNEQGGKCAICHEVSDKLHIDHCHTHGHVRGLLCKNCNSAIGLLKEKPCNFISAITYLDRTQKATNAE